MSQGIAVFTVWTSPLAAETLPQREETLSLADSVQTMQQDFREAPVWRKGAVQVNEKPKSLSDASFSWAAGYIWNHPPLGVRDVWPQPTRNFPAWTSNGAADADPNGDMIAKIDKSYAPLRWSGTLDLTAQKMPAALAATVGNNDPHGYISGAITSFPFSQLYGVFAISAKLPRGHGTWPAFWLVPSDKSWPPEIDIMEVIGREPSKLYTTLHYKDGSFNAHATDTGLDLSAQFHEYAVDWGPNTLRWYFDRKLVFFLSTPEELKKPNYLLVNLGIGLSTSWGGAPDETTELPATMKIAYIKVWQRENHAINIYTGP